MKLVAILLAASIAFVAATIAVRAETTIVDGKIVVTVKVPADQRSGDRD